MKLLFAALKYDYGIFERGESLERRAFLPALKKVVGQVETFWFEENGFPDNIKVLQKNLIEFADLKKPDIVFFILMKDEIEIKTLECLTQKYLTVNWFCDDQWRFEEFTTKIAPELSACITVDKYSLKKYQDIGCKNVYLSQWATFDYDEDLLFDPKTYKYDVSFVGSRNPTREWVVECLKKEGIHVNCFGDGWNNGRVSYNEMKEVFLDSKINLNLSNSVPNDFRFLKFVVGQFLHTFLRIPITHPAKSKKLLFKYLGYLKFYFSSSKTTEQIKARNFEIPGCGGFQLSQFALEIEDYFLIGTEIAIFTNNNELAKQCHYYLKNDEEREIIKANGYKRTSEHTYYRRLRSALEHLFLKTEGGEV